MDTFNEQKICYARRSTQHIQRYSAESTLYPTKFVTLIADFAYNKSIADEFIQFSGALSAKLDNAHGHVCSIYIYCIVVDDTKHLCQFVDANYYHRSPRSTYMHTGTIDDNGIDFIFENNVK